MAFELKEISPASLEKSAREYVLVDIRRASEWQLTGIVENSHLLTFFDEYGRYDLQQWLEKFEALVPTKDTPFVLICAHANRTLDVGLFLVNKLGYENAYHLRGGIINWLQEGRSVVTV